MDNDDVDVNEPLDLDDEVGLDDNESEEEELDKMGMHVEEPKDDDFV